MYKKSRTVYFKCECGHETQVDCHPYIHATYDSPAEGGYFDPENCNNCGAAITFDDIIPLVQDEIDDEVYALEQRYERKEEDRRCRRISKDWD